MLRPKQIMLETPVVSTVTNNIQNYITQQAREELWKCLHIQALNKSRPDLRGMGTAFIQHHHFAPSNHAEQWIMFPILIKLA